jgi:hypothetical protein
MKSDQGHSRNSSKTEEALKLWKIEESSSDFTLYDFPELAAATDNFSEDNKLGKGGFGPVYKASVSNVLHRNVIDQLLISALSSLSFLFCFLGRVAWWN